MNDRIYISTSAFRNKNINSILNECHRYALTNIELGSNLEYSEDVLGDLRKHANNSMRFLVHNYFPRPRRDFILNLASEKADIATRSIEHCKCAIDISAEFGSPFYSVHAGYAFNPSLTDLGNPPIKNPELFSYKKAAEIFRENIVALNKYAENKGIGLLVENHEVCQANIIDGKNLLFLMPTTRELAELYSYINSENFGFLIDVAHLKISANTLGFSKNDFIRDLGHTIRAFHISDNDGLLDTHCKFDENAWFKDIIGRNERSVFIIESRAMETDTIIGCIHSLEIMMRKTNAFTA